VRIYYNSLSLTPAMVELPAIALRTEPQLDGGTMWSQPQRGNLLLGAKSLRFNDWEIPVSNIEEAVFNTDRIVFSKRQSLAVNCGEMHYLFNLEKAVDVPAFPFRVEITERRTFIGKLIISALAIFVVGVTWNAAMIVLASFR